LEDKVMNNKIRKLVIAVLAVGAVGFTPANVNAQTDPSAQIIPSIELQGADIRDALAILFRNVGVSYTIAPDVQGTVTVNLKNVPFETALRNILNQADATYRVEAGIYQIIRREQPVGPIGDTGVAPIGPGTTTVVRRLRIRHADPLLIMQLLAGSAQPGTPPEQSTASGLGGMGGGMGGMGGGGMGGGMGGFGGGGMGGMGGGMGGMGGGGFGGMGGGGFGGGGGGGLGRG
jgi:hypothetical protein